MKQLKTRLNKNGRNLIIGMTIGDGCIANKGYLTINHSYAQKYYCNWKRDLLKKNGVPVGVFREFEQINGYSKGKKVKKVAFQTLVLDFCKVLRRVIYDSNKGKYRRKLLNRIGAQGLAIWIMDDGSLLRRSKVDKVTGERKYSGFYISIATYCSLEEAETIILYFKEEWGLNPTKVFDKRQQSYTISFCAREGRKLIQIIRPYMCPTMMYKVIPDLDDLNNYMKMLKDTGVIPVDGTDES